MTSLPSSSWQLTRSQGTGSVRFGGLNPSSELSSDKLPQPTQSMSDPAAHVHGQRPARKICLFGTCHAPKCPKNANNHDKGEYPPYNTNTQDALCYE